MGFLDKVKKFAGGKNMAAVEVTSVNGTAPDATAITISDKSITGSMLVTAKEDCTILATKYEVILRTKGDDGAWSDIVIANAKDKDVAELSPGATLVKDWCIADVDIPQYLRNQEFVPNDAVGNASVKLIINCIADVKGSPFDPSAEVEVSMERMETRPVDIDITVIEGMPAHGSQFPVTDSVLKGTVVVAANEACELTATKYEICLRVDGNDLVVASAQNPELDPNPLSVSFGGINIEFPLQMKPGKKATQTWMVADIDLAAALAKQGFEDAGQATTDERVQLVVRCSAAVKGNADATSESFVALTR